MKPKQKTRVISEAELRAFNKCSEFWNFGGLVELPLKTAFLEFVYIKMILDILKQTQFDYKGALNLNLKHAERQMKLSERFAIAEAQEFVRHAAIGVDEIFKLMSPAVYVPVFGAFEYPVRVLNSVVNLRIASLLVTNTRHSASATKRTYHAVSFSPYVSERDMENDIVQTMKIMSLRNASPLTIHGGDALVRLHLFSTGVTTTDLKYTTVDITNWTDTRTWAQYLEQPIRLMEARYHFPVVPCHHGCPFKQKCRISPTGGR